MLKNLTPKNDKMEMIVIIKFINKRINLFFNNLKFKKIKLYDEITENNILNINGNWGSGKSTIINNLEKYWKFKSEKPIFIIINLWEYEIIDNPYYDIIQDIIRNILPFVKKENIIKKNSKIKKFLNRIKTLTLGIPITDPNTGFTINPTIKVELDNIDKETQDLKTMIKDATDEIEELIHSTKKNIIIIFDELDRCLPYNQIKFLSYIKNIFLKLRNVFYVVSSNNEVINANINNISIEKGNILNERYTDKIFNVTINLKDIFFTENMKFSENDYIQEFINQENIINPRIIKKILFQVNNTISDLKQDISFSFLKEKNINSWKINTIKRLELIIFYIKYNKLNNHNYYNQLIKYTDINSTEWGFLIKKLKEIAKKYEQKIFKSKSNKQILEWILKNKTIYFENSEWYINQYNQIKSKSLYFYIEINDNILPIWFSCLLPFLGFYINRDFEKNIFFEIIEYPLRDERMRNIVYYEIKNRDYKNFWEIVNRIGQVALIIKVKKLNIPNHLKAFFNILIKDFDAVNFILDEFKISFDTIETLVGNAIFDY